MRPNFLEGIRRSNLWIANAHVISLEFAVGETAGNQAGQTTQARFLIADQAIFNRDDVLVSGC